MTERERWIVYPLLFLALGASLRDKIIKTTESQRIKTQGLYVYEEVGNKSVPVLVLGADQFPDLPNRNLDEMAMDRVTAIQMEAGALNTDIMRTKQLTSLGNIQADHVITKTLSLTDGQRSVTLQGTNALLQILSMLQQQKDQNSDQDQAKAAEETEVGKSALPPPSDEAPRPQASGSSEESSNPTEQSSATDTSIEEPKRD